MKKRFYKRYDFKEKFTLNKNYLESCQKSRLIKIYNFKESDENELDTLKPFVKCTNIFCVKIFATESIDDNICLKYL